MLFFFYDLLPLKLSSFSPPYPVGSLALQLEGFAKGGLLVPPPAKSILQ